MEGLNEKRAVELNRVKAAEQQRDDLAPRKAEAEQYIATEAQLNAKKGALYQLREGEAAVLRRYGIAVDLAAKA